MNYFSYTQKEMDYLIKRDSILGEVIKEVGFIKRTVNKNLFSSLVEHIISQQISGKSAETVISRLKEQTSLTPENIFKMDLEKIKNCGMSYRKAEYIKNAGEKFFNKEIIINPNLTDDEIINILTSLKGVGVWTAEMLLIFCFCRKNILSYHDFAIKKGIIKLYNLETVTKKDFNKLKEIYSPYCTIASFYLWNIGNKN